MDNFVEIDRLAGRKFYWHLITNHEASLNRRSIPFCRLILDLSGWCAGFLGILESHELAEPQRE